MKNIITTTIIIITAFPFMAAAQISHYFTINTAPYGNYFNAEKEPFKKPDFTYWNTIPRMSNKFEYKRHGLEFYYTYFNRGYNKVSTPADGAILEVNHQMLGLNYQYKFFKHKYFSLSALAGINYGQYFASALDFTYSPPGYRPHYIYSDRGGTENVIGYQTGLDINVPVWRNFYLSNTNRFTFNPTVEKEIFSKNLVVEVGIGYRFARKKKEKE